MQIITSTAHAVGAGHGHAIASEAALPEPGQLMLQPGFAPISRRDLLTAVNIAARDLGLRQTSVVVLDALLSCLPCKPGDNLITAQMLLTVYASNQTLCFRARGLTERQLRRHLEVLETAGLLRRRDSANGKRFPVHQAGKVTAAFGLDLSPLLERSDEILRLAATRKDQDEELRGLKAQILRLRAGCQDLDLPPLMQDFVEGLRNLTRRVGLTLTEARAVLAKLGQLYSAGTDAPCPATAQAAPAAEPQAGDQTKEMTGSDGENVRHTEPKEPEHKTTGGSEQQPETDYSWNSLTAVKSFYDHPPRNERDGEERVSQLGRMLHLDEREIARGLAMLGWRAMLVTENRIAGNIERIANPNAYLRAILSGAAELALPKPHTHLRKPAWPERRTKKTASQWIPAS